MEGEHADLPVIGDLVAEPLGARDMAARGLGERFVSRRRFRGWLTVLVGAGLLAGGFARFGVYGAVLTPSRIGSIEKTPITRAFSVAAL